MSQLDSNTYDTRHLRQDAHILYEALHDCEMTSVAGTPHNFVWNSLTEQTPPTPRYLLKAVARLMHAVGRDIFESADLLSSEEDRGAILAAAVQNRVNLPLAISRWVTQPKEDRPSIPLTMEYANAQLHFDGMTTREPTKKVAIVDDLISTGGTMVAQCRAIREQTRHEILGVVLVADKGSGGAERLEREIGIQPRLIAQMDCTGVRSVVTQLYLPDGDMLLRDIQTEIRRKGRRFFDNRHQRLIRER